METVFIEIDKCIFNTGSNIVIGVIYRMHNSSVDVFNDRISDILNVIQKEHKLCYFLGDLNIDFLKADDHRATGELLDVLYCCNVFPLITKPTRVTSTTATLIDHILTYYLLIIWFIFNVNFELQFQIIMLFSILQAMPKQIMPRLKCLFLNVIWDNEIFQNLFLKWTRLTGNLC